MSRAHVRLVALVCLLALIGVTPGRGANIGRVVPVIGQVSDLVYDPLRNQVYLSNFTENRVEVYSVAEGRLIGSVSTGLQPSSLALTPDSQTLYVANFGSNTLTAIDLNAGAVSAEIPVGARPDAIAIGNDGQVVVLGSSGLMRFEPVTQQFFRLPITPPPATPPGLPAVLPGPVPQAFRASLRAAADGATIIGISNNRLFVYETASGAVLRSRNVTGLPPTISVSPNGTRFMAGPFLFDSNTLTILGRTAFSNVNLLGGSVFSPDGNTVYASFPPASTDRPINALNPNQLTGAARLPGQAPTLGILQVMRASSLTPELGLRLEEAITSRMVAAPDGQNLFALSTSGLLAIPIGRLNQLPILDVETTTVVLTADICSRGIATVDVPVRNAGGGRMTFAAQLNNQNAPGVSVSARSGVARSSVQIRYDASRATARGTQQFVVILASPEAVNVEPAILVNVNFRDVDQRGTIVPLRGLGADMLLDEQRRRLYIADFMNDQIEVFSIPDQRFLPPVRVGNQPRSMAMVGSSTLVVANSGAEAVSVVDLETLQEIDVIPMAPVPLNAAPFFPRSIAVSSNAILFSAGPLTAPGVAPGNGSIWQLSLATRTAFPRLNLGGTTANVVNGRNSLIAPENGSAIVVLEGNGTLRYYDPLSDSFPITRTGAVAGVRGTASAAADGSYYVFDNLVFNPVLSPRGSMAPGGVAGASAVAFGVASAGNDALRIQAADAQVPVQRVQRVNLNVLQAQQEFRIPEAVMDITPGAATPPPPGQQPVVRTWPPLPIQLLLSARGQTSLWTRGMLMDRGNTTYMLTMSGLTIVSLAPVTGRGPTFRAEGVVNGASFRAPVAPGSIISLFGADLGGETASAGEVPLPSNLSGICVTANDVPMPLFFTSPTQINAQLPPELAAGNVTIAVRSRTSGRSSPGVAVRVNATAPGVFAVEAGGRTQAALFHADDFSPVTPSHAGQRDRDLILFATGLGRVLPPVAAGRAAPPSPLSVTASAVSVTIGGRGMIVTFAGLAPGFVGLYQINIRVPGDRAQGDNLPVVVSVGGVSSVTTGAPVAAIH